MEFFSKTTPNLVSKKTLKGMEQILAKDPVKEIGISDNFGNFYNNYISPNTFVLMLFIIFCLFLFYRYTIKQANNENFVPLFRPTFNHLAQK